MRKFLTLILFFVIGGTALNAQQDPMFTKYMFNSLVYNPAYAGYYDHMYISALYRKQWEGIDGAPTTQTLTLHTPLKNNRVGVGFHVLNDAIGPTEETRAFGAYSYKIPLGGDRQLAIGIQGGVSYRRGDRSKVTLENESDPSFSDLGDNLVLPNFGAGLLYYTSKFYFGVSVPNLIEHDLRRDEFISSESFARQFRHYYLATGAAIPLNGDILIFKPSILIKNVGLLSNLSKDAAFQDIGAPTEFDIDLSLLFYEQFQVGLSFRSAVQAFGGNNTSSFDSADIWMSYFLDNGLRLGVAFDYPLNALNNSTFGSFEILVGYEFDYDVKKTVTPRYF